MLAYSAITLSNGSLSLYAFCGIRFAEFDPAVDCNFVSVFRSSCRVLQALVRMDASQTGANVVSAYPQLPGWTSESNGKLTVHYAPGLIWNLPAGCAQ